MDKTYLTLFKELARATEIAAEQVMEYDHKKGDEKAEETAQIMREDYIQLHDKLSKEDFDGILTKKEYAKLLAAAFIVSNNLKDRMTGMRKALAGYETDVIPKLSAIVDNTTTDEEAQKMAEETFILKENN